METRNDNIRTEFTVALILGLVFFLSFWKLRTETPGNIWGRMVLWRLLIASVAWTFAFFPLRRSIGFKACMLLGGLLFVSAGLFTLGAIFGTNEISAAMSSAYLDARILTWCAFLTAAYVAFFALWSVSQFVRAVQIAKQSNVDEKKSI